MKKKKVILILLAAALSCNCAYGIITAHASEESGCLSAEETVVTRCDEETSDLTDSLLVDEQVESSEANESVDEEIGNDEEKADLNQDLVPPVENNVKDEEEVLEADEEYISQDDGKLLNEGENEDYTDDYEEVSEISDYESRDSQGKYNDSQDEWVYGDEDNKSSYVDGISFEERDHGAVVYSMSNYKSEDFYFPDKFNEDGKTYEVTGIDTRLSYKYAKIDSIKNIYVNKNNTRFTDIDGVMYSKDKSTLVRYPSGRTEKTFMVPKYVKRIEVDGFSNDNLISLVIPDGLEEMKICSAPLGSSDHLLVTPLNRSTKLKALWTSKEQYEKIKNAAYYNGKLIESNLYDRENYYDDVIRIKADNVQCFEKLNDGSEEEVKLEKSSDGFYIHSPKRDKKGTRYYYYKAEIDGAVYESPIISVTVDEVDDPENHCWNSENKCVIDEIRYRKNEDGSASIIANKNLDPRGEVVIPSDITVGGISYPVKNIETDSFKDCNKMTKVIIPDTIEQIDEAAFVGCRNLKAVVLPKNLKSIENSTFEQCTSLEDIIIPNSVEYIGKYAFEFCDSLEEIIIPESVKTIDEGAFWYCKNLKNVKFLGDTIELGKKVFEGCDNCTYEGCAAKFVDYKDAVKVIIPEGVESTDEAQFANYKSLKEVVLPSTLKTIANCTFENCESLESITLPESLQTIGKYAFNNCKNLKEIIIPQGVRLVDDGAFFRCANLESVKILNGSSNIYSDTDFGKNVFCGCNDKCIYRVKNGIYIYRLTSTGARYEYIRVNSYL